MNHSYIQSLKKIIDQFGKNVFKEPLKIQSLLMDFCKEYEKENNLRMEHLKGVKGLTP
jgi:hypothetical protein